MFTGGDWWVEIDMGMRYTGVQVDGSVIRIPFQTRGSAEVCAQSLTTKIRPERQVIPGSIVTGDDDDEDGNSRACPGGRTGPGGVRG